jgi:hypothetical protein
MAGIQLKDLPEALASGDDDLLHIQTEGSFVDQKIKKSVLLAEFLNEFDQLKQDVQDSLKAIAVVHTGGGTLVEGRINEIQDSLGYFLPKANSVPINTTIDISVTDKFASVEPLVIADTSLPDTIQDELNTYSDILFNAGAVTIRLTSDGVSEWRL